MNSLTRQNPRTWSPLSELFDEFWNWSATQRPLTATTEAQWTPACEVEENDHQYLITLEMPGVSKDQIKVEYHDQQLVVSGERKNETKTKENGQWYTERRFGKFQRTFTLPAGVDGDKLEAHYQDGVLRVFVPKAETAKPRQIQINQGTGPGFLGRLLGNGKKDESKNDAHVA